MIPTTCLLCQSELIQNSHVFDVNEETLQGSRSKCSQCLRYKDPTFKHLSGFDILHANDKIYYLSITFDKLTLQICYSLPANGNRIYISEEAFKGKGFRDLVDIPGSFPYQHNLDYLKKKIKLLLTFR